MIGPKLRRQLIVFVAMSVVALTVLGVNYLKVPQVLGVGRYEITVALPESAGLYSGAPVTYRGVTVGQVKGIVLADSGVVATLSLEEGRQIPQDAVAEVANASVIGEPGIDFVGSAGAQPLEAGARVPSSQVRLPTTTGALLTEVHGLLKSVPREALRITVHEAYLGLNGSEDKLGSLLDSASSLQAAASANQKETFQLIDRLGPVLTTQQRLRGELLSAAANLGLFTDTLAREDSSLRTVIAQAPSTARLALSLLSGLERPLRSLLTGTSQLGRVLEVYTPALRHILIVLPALIEANRAVAPLHVPKSTYAESGLSFKLGVNNPPVCTDGFFDAGKQRAPQDVSPAPLPVDSYCKVAPADPRVVRGARNMPCPNDPSRRGATAILCGLVFNPDEVRP